MYFKSAFERICGKLPHRELTIRAKELMDAGNAEIKDLRQKSKSVTFGASYGAFPPKIANSINCSLEEAEQIFHAYHNELYPKITEYRENYVLPTCRQHKKLHLGLGFYINTKDPDADIRTLANASIQFWSILSILAINELHRRIDSAGYQSQIKVISSIYDSIYLEVLDDPAIIQWANNNLIECMTRDFMPNQTVPNVAESEIGYSWASLKPIPNNATLDEINSTRQLLKA